MMSQISRPSGVRRSTGVLHSTPDSWIWLKGLSPPGVSWWANTEITRRLPCPLLLLKERSWPMTVTVAPTVTGTASSSALGTMTGSSSACPDRRSTDSVKR